jgi:hypothetical protein
MRNRVSSFQLLDYIDPKPFLVRLLALNAEVSRSDLSKNVRTLRTNELKIWREMREGALFAYAMALRLGQSVLIAKAEAQNLDYDCVTRREGPEDKVFYGPVQIKEVVPHRLNRDTSVQEIVDRLTAYASPDLSVVIHLNRLAEFDPGSLKIPKLGISTLWVIAALSPNQRRWGLWGDFLGDLGVLEFDYPVTL